MTLTFIAIGIAVVVAAVLVWVRHYRNKSEFERHILSVEQLHLLLASEQKISLFDVRQPLDLLAYPELIPGAQRLPPQEVLDNPSLIPRDKDVVVYCTCPGDKTSRTVLRRALRLGLFRIKFLKGGLAGWKAKGYPIEPYKEVFHLYPSLVPRSH